MMKQKKKVQVGTEVKPSWEHLTNDPPRPFLPGNLEEVFTISCLCIQAMQTSKNKSHERERRNIDCFDNCFAIAKETAPLVTMVSTSVLFYLQSSHRHHHGKNINTITKKSKHFRKGKTNKSARFPLICLLKSLGRFCFGVNYGFALPT